VGLTLRHPEIDEMIGPYRVVGLLGAGGLGIVYKVERGGRFFALKLLLVPALDGRGKREIGILIHLEHPCVVRYVGSDFWPDPVIGHPYIVMEFVPGETLWVFAYSQNPAARKATRIILDVALTLGEVHAAGVLHRDVKPENIIIRGASERPILIDFGIGSLASAPTITGSTLPPGTEEFRSPEQIRFRRAHEDDGAQYGYGPADEMWALGVTYYWLLTDALPFGERTDPGELDGLRERILTHRPEAPHVVNPRVPLTASLLCMRMLAERQEDRYPVIATLCAALNESLSSVENDATWDAPLGDPDDPQLTTTVEDRERGGLSETRRAFLRLSKQRPRRGRPLPKGERVFFLPEQVAGPPIPAVAADPDEIPTVEAPGVPPTPVEHELPVTGALVPPAREQLEPAVAPHSPRSALRLGLAVAVLVLAGVALSVGADLWRPGSSSPTSEARPELPLPSTSPGPHATDAGVRGREVALDSKPLESLAGGDATPVGAQLPVSTANAMFLKIDARSKAEEKPTSQPQRTGTLSPLKKTAAVGIACALLDGGCAGATSQVRSAPEPEACPPGWVQSMKTLGIGIGASGVASPTGTADRITVREGETAAKLAEEIGDLQPGTVLHGRFIVRESRVYGRFTLAERPNGDTFPVCLEMQQTGKKGYERLDEGGGASAEIAGGFVVRTVERFE
jgi:serine/threonine-protein kinase